MSGWVMLAILGGVVACGVIEYVRERHPGGRIARILDLHDHAEQQGRDCDRCRTGNLWLPCACDIDCYAAACRGGLAPLDPLDPDPALGCPYCAPPFAASADCSCSRPCGDPGCGALTWLAVARTEEWER